MIVKIYENEKARRITNAKECIQNTPKTGWSKTNEDTIYDALEHYEAFVLETLENKAPIVEEINDDPDKIMDAIIRHSKNIDKKHNIIFIFSGHEMNILHGDMYVKIHDLLDKQKYDCFNMSISPCPHGVSLVRLQVFS